MKEKRPASRQEFLLTNRGPDDTNLSTRNNSKVLACRLVRAITF
jgi:hypothetical protein